MIFVRHAESQWNSHFGPTRIDPGINDPALTAIGAQQARSAQEMLDQFEISRIITSPYTRTLQTAHVLCEKCRVKVEIDPRVGERRVFSCDIGSKASDLKTRWPDVDFSNLPEIWWSPLIESMQTFEARCHDFLQEMSHDSQAKTTLVVTHWGFIRATTGRAVANAEFVQPHLSAEFP